MNCYKASVTVVATLLFLFISVAPIWSQEIERVDINKASAQELAKLQEVGPKYAVRIIEYRQKYGPFKLTEELMDVPGIGPFTYDRIKDLIIAQ